MYTSGTIANSQTQRVSTKIKKMVLLSKYIYKNFSGTRDTIKHVKTFRAILMKCHFYFLS